MATITLGANDYEAFASVEYADTYLGADILRSAVWSPLNTEAKGRALISATRMMLALPWCVDPVPDPAVDQDEPIPSVAAMLAADLIANPKLLTDATGASNIKVAKAGSASVEFFSPVDGGPPLPRSLWDLLIAANLVCLSRDGETDTTLDGAQPFGTSDCIRPYGGRYPWDWPIASLDYD